MTPRSGSPDSSWKAPIRTVTQGRPETYKPSDTLPTAPPAMYSAVESAIFNYISNVLAMK